MRNRSGFTLLEVVLAIGLAGTVLGLLMIAIELYLVRVDASRTQVESSQLARTLLNQLASDLHAVRYFSESTASGNDGEDDGEDDEASTDPLTIQGIFGTETELRIDRSAIWQWASLARQIDQTNSRVDSDTMPAPDQKSMPQTVRYLLGEGNELLAAKMASVGVSEQRLAAGYAGLYREQLSTAAWFEQYAEIEIPLDTGETDNAELIAPEVVELVFAYFDGQKLRTEWDSSVEEGLPKGVEIRLTLLVEPFEQAVTHTPGDRDELRRKRENLVEYRRFVKLPDVRKPYPVEFPESVDSSEEEGGFGL